MEHSWGRNVQEKGLGALGATLAARLLLLPGEVYLINAQPHAPTAITVQVFPDTAPFPMYLFGAATKFTPRFPYGQTVEADVPL